MADERLLIGRIARALRPLPRALRSKVRLSIGDDAALVRPALGQELVLTCDAFLEKRHFLADVHLPDSIGYKALARATSDLAQPGEEPLAAEVAALARPWGVGALLLEVAYLEAHWAFYRAGAILLWGDYAGIFLGLAVAILEMLARRQLWSRLRQPGQADGFLLTISLAFVVTILFLFTHNLWVCAIVHGVLALGLLSLLRRWSQQPALTSG